MNKKFYADLSDKDFATSFLTIVFLVVLTILNTNRFDVVNANIVWSFIAYCLGMGMINR